MYISDYNIVMIKHNTKELEERKNKLEKELCEMHTQLEQLEKEFNSVEKEYRLKEEENAVIEINEIKKRLTQLKDNQTLVFDCGTFNIVSEFLCGKRGLDAKLYTEFEDFMKKNYMWFIKVTLVTGFKSKCRVEPVTPSDSVIDGEPFVILSEGGYLPMTLPQHVVDCLVPQFTEEVERWWETTTERPTEWKLEALDSVYGMTGQIETHTFGIANKVFKSI